MKKEGEDAEYIYERGCARESESESESEKDIGEKSLLKRLSLRRYDIHVDRDREIGS